MKAEHNKPAGSDIRLPVAGDQRNSLRPAAVEAEEERMFEQSFVEAGIRRTKRPWTVAVSVVLQGALLAMGVLLPLLNYYKLPAAELMTFLEAPTPPPAAPPPAPATVELTKQPLSQFDAGRLVEPARIPEKVAIIQDQMSTRPAQRAGIEGGIPSGLPESGLHNVISRVIANRPPPPPPPPDVKREPGKIERIKVGGEVQGARLVRRVSPTYPVLARQARVQGVVRLTAVISRDGTIQRLEVLGGHPLLVPAALRAVQQWRYRPTLLNRTPVEVLTQIEVNFTLSR